MEIAYSSINVSSAILYGGWGGYPLGQFSDGRLWALVRVPNGSNYDFRIYVSVDGGLTWSLGVEALTNSTQSLMTALGSGDSIYLLAINYPTNTTIKCYRVDYSGGECTLAVNGTTIVTTAGLRTAQAAVQPGGRLWVIGIDIVTGTVRLNAYYSDSGGSTWSTAKTSIDSLAGGIITWRPALLMLEKRLVICYVINRDNPCQVYTVDRLHADAVTTWGSPVSRKTLSQSSLASWFQAAPLVESPVRHGLISLTDPTNPGTIWGLRAEHDADGAMTYTLLDSFQLPAGGGTDPNVVVSGRQDGWQVSYLAGNSLDTVRWRDVAAAASTWPSEQTSVATDVFSGVDSFGTIMTLPGLLGENILCAGSLSGSPYIQIAYSGLSTLLFVQELQIETIGVLAAVSTLPVEFLGRLTTVESLEVEWEGLWLAFLHAIIIRVPLDQSFLHSVTVAPAATFADFAHRVTVRSSLAGGDFLHTVRVVRPGLLAQFGEDVQQPYAKVTRD